MPKEKAKGTTAMVKWNEKLAEMAKQNKKAVAGIGTGGNFISCKGGHLAYQGQIIPGNQMKVIVVDWCLENQHYAEAFSEDAPSSPDCYAFGRVKDEMAPNPEHVEAPVNATCEGCEFNQWGSADTGKGKACAEVARLALLSEADFAGEDADIEKANEAYIKVPVTSMKYWAGYVRDLETVHHRPPMAFVTILKLVPQKELPGWHMEFELSEAIEDVDVIEALMNVNEKVSAKIMFPYPKFEAAPPPAKKAAPARKPLPPAAVAPAAKGKKGTGVAVPKF